MRKYKGIDARRIKCCDNAPNTVQAGISFDYVDDQTPVLLFHFIDNIGSRENPLLHQTTKSMYLNKKTIKALRKQLKNLL